MSTPIQIVHLPEQQRFEAVVEGLACVVDYRLAAGVAWLTHTGVPKALAGRGIAAQLVAYALECAREQGWKVRPSCSYVAAYMRRHPDTEDLLAP